MAQVTVVYKDFDEMVAVARELLKGELKPEQTPDTPAMDSNVTAGYSPAPAVNPTRVTATAPASEAVAAAVVTAPAPVGQSVAPTVPTTEHTYTRDELSRAAMTLMDKGMQVQLQQLIQSYGVASLVELPADQYGNFATALRGLGAQI